MKEGDGSVHDVEALDLVERRENVCIAGGAVGVHYELRAARDGSRSARSMGKRGREHNGRRSKEGAEREKTRE